MTFNYPVLLFLFFIFIPLAIFDIASYKKRQLLSKELDKKIKFSLLFFRLFLAFAIIAAAGPRWGISYAPSEFRRGLDIVFAVDISRSMDLRDAQPNASVSRLERGISIAQETIVSVSGARYAAAAGRGRGYLTVPLTYDSEAAAVFLEAAGGSSMTGRSTNIESLIDAAAGAFQSASPARKVIVLISDGESHSGVIRNAVNRCIKENIIINAVAVGSDEGRQIREQEMSSSSEHKADEESLSQNAQPVISRRDAVVMRNTAERSGGVYIDGSREDAASYLCDHLLSLSRGIGITQTDTEITGSAGGRKEPKQRRALFTILALISFAVSKLITRSFRVFENSNRNFRFPLISLLILFIFSSCADGKLLLLEANYLNARGRHNEAIELYLKALNYEKASAYAEYGLGLTFYSLDETENALNRYGISQKILEKSSINEGAAKNGQNIQTHRELRYRNHYNSGIILFEEGDFESAAFEFKEALRAEPKRIEAKRNLELSLISITTEANRQNPAEEKYEQKEILFDYLKQEEEQKWRSREWTPEENYSGPDY